MYDNICKECGAYLDPGEKCDCKKDNQNSDGKDAQQDGKSSNIRTS